MGPGRTQGDLTKTRTGHLIEEVMRKLTEARVMLYRILYRIKRFDDEDPEIAEEAMDILIYCLDKLAEEGS